MTKKEISTKEAVAVLLLFPFALATYAISLKMLWNWFVATLGFPTINAVHGFGISVFVSLLLAGKANQTQKEGVGPLTQMVGLILGALLCLGVGWIAHHFQ